MRTSFRAALTDWKCVVQKSGCSTMIEAPCFNEAYNMCACYAGNARHVRNGTSQADKTKQAVVNGKTQAVFSRNSSRCPVFFFAQKPPRTICLRNVSGRNNEPASADPTKHLNANRNAKQKRQRKSRARAQGAGHIGIPKHP